MVDPGLVAVGIDPTQNIELLFGKRLPLGHGWSFYRFPAAWSDSRRSRFQKGVESRPSNEFTISVARRDSVALMDRYIGPKS